MQRTKERSTHSRHTNSRKKSQETDRQQDAAELNNGAKKKPPHTVVQNGKRQGNLNGTKPRRGRKAVAQQQRQNVKDRLPRNNDEAKKKKKK
jgi:hypothetical protein